MFSSNLVPRSLSPLVVFGTLAPLFGTPSLLVLDLSTLYTAFKSNLKTHLFCSSSISSSYQHNPCASDSHLHVDFSAEIIFQYITLHYTLCAVMSGSQKHMESFARRIILLESMDIIYELSIPDPLRCIVQCSLWNNDESIRSDSEVPSTSRSPTMEETLQPFSQK